MSSASDLISAYMRGESSAACCTSSSTRRRSSTTCSASSATSASSSTCIHASGTAPSGTSALSATSKILTSSPKASRSTTICGCRRCWMPYIERSSSARSESIRYGASLATMSMAVVSPSMSALRSRISSSARCCASLRCARPVRAARSLLARAAASRHLPGSDGKKTSRSTRGTDVRAVADVRAVVSSATGTSGAARPALFIRGHLAHRGSPRSDDRRTAIILPSPAHLRTRGDPDRGATPSSSGSGSAVSEPPPRRSSRVPAAGRHAESTPAACTRHRTEPLEFARQRGLSSLRDNVLPVQLH